MHPPTLPTLALLTTLTSAQNSTNTTCPNQQDLNQAATGPINSTGIIPFRPIGSKSAPWYLSVLVNATSSDTIARPYLSVPRNVSANTCVFGFGPRNATSVPSPGGDSAGCAGVLSAKCRALLGKELIDGAGALGSQNATCRMPSFSGEAGKAREEACGKMVTIGVNGYRNIANETCANPSLAGVQLPDDYVTKVVGSALQPFDVWYNDRWDEYVDMAYDLLTIQSAAYAVVVSTEDEDEGCNLDVQFVCVTPNQTQPGSRVAENKTPWEDEGTSGAWRAAPGLGVVITAVMGVLLVL